MNQNIKTDRISKQRKNLGILRSVFLPLFCIFLLLQAFSSPGINAQEKKDSLIYLFNSSSLEGWRGYNRNDIPSAWIVENGCITTKKFKPGEKKDVGDIIYNLKFKNFELSFEWKVGKGSNSGILYLGQEVPGEPLYISAPEYQILDNQHHKAAFLGVDGNRQSASLYDMIPARPQNANPYGNWNSGKIIVKAGLVRHFQNGVQVLEYHLRGEEWIKILQNSKFSEEKWPLAFELMSEAGGENHEGFIGIQYHGGDAWFRNIVLKILE